MVSNGKPGEIARHLINQRTPAQQNQPVEKTTSEKEQSRRREGRKHFWPIEKYWPCS